MSWQPYIILSLPRSRSYWLSQFLDSSARPCGHDTGRWLNTLADWPEQFASQRYAGVVETGAVQHWQTISHLVPEARLVALLRPVDEVRESLARVGWTDPELEAKAKALAQLVKVPGVLVLESARLGEPSYASAVWETLHGRPPAQAWVGQFCQMNLQVDLAQRQEELRARSEASNKVREELRVFWHLREVQIVKVSVSGHEALQLWLGQEQTELLARAGGAGAEADRVCMPDFARILELERLGALHVWHALVDGQVAGHTVLTLQPDLEQCGILTCTQNTLYVRPTYARLGLGRKLLHASLSFGKASGAKYAYLHHRAAGPGAKTKALALRLGAVPLEQNYSLRLEDYDA